MAGCDRIDWTKTIDPEGFSPEEAEHIRTCPSCRRELEAIEKLQQVFAAHFEIAENVHCPREKEIPGLLWPNGTATDSTLEAHMKACPACTRAFLSLKTFDQAFEPPSTADAPLPDALRDAVKVYRRRQVSSRTRQVLEQFSARAKNGGKWVEEVLQNIFADRAEKPAPAARNDLTRSRKEQEEDDADKDSREPDKKDP